MLFLVVLGGAAILEAHRAYNQNSSEDISDLKAKEDAIIKQLEVRFAEVCGDAIVRTRIYAPCFRGPAATGGAARGGFGERCSPPRRCSTTTSLHFESFELYTYAVCFGAHAVA